MSDGPRAGSRFLTIALSLGLFLAVGCGGEEDTGADGQAMETESAASAEAGAAGSGEGIPVEPTAADELPDAVLGTAPPPRGRDLRYLEDDPSTVGYLAVPGGDGPFPAVVLIHEWNGLNDRVRQVADALAAEGYVALAADLYQGRTGSNPDENRALVQETRSNPEQMIGNLDAAVRYLRDRPDVTGRVAAMGWCFGGGVALSYGLDGEDHEGTAIFYGSLLEDPGVLAELNHEVYGTFAEMDSGIPPEAVEGFAQALDEAGVPHDLHIYDGVGHGFWLWVDEDPDARRQPALDAWQRLKGYLDRTLRG